jgi:hypothetical protein
MPAPELPRPPGRRTHSHGPIADSEPIHPTPLPAELQEFLRDRDFACVTLGSDQGTVLILKAPSRDILSARGHVPIELRHELYEFPTAPVVRMVTTIYDQPERPLRFESFVNVEDEQQRAEYAALSRQEHLLMLFYDERLDHRLTKQVGQLDGERIADVLSRAEALFQAIPEEQFDFEAAKAWVMARTDLR